MSRPRVVFIEPAMRVSTWRTTWPARELARRGHDVVTFAQDSRRKGEAFATDTVILHLTAGAWMESETDIATPFSTVQRLLDVMPAERVRVSFSDDLTQLWHVQEATPNIPITYVPPGTDGRVGRGAGTDGRVGPAEANPITLRLRLFIADLPVICRQVGGVIVTTPKLAQVYGKWSRRVDLAQPYLPRWVFDLPRWPSNGRLGWMGTLEVHRRDLELLKPWARELPPMHLVGPGKAGADLLQSWGVRDVTATPTVYDQRKLYREMGRCRAAVIPLVTDGKLGRFNAGKSWIKPMEFGALGVPWVASRFGPYEALPATSTVIGDVLGPAAIHMWHRADDPSMMDRRAALLDAGFTMEQRGGDEWERALGLT